MGYFSNGTQGALYEERWCSRCANYSEDDGCAVLMIHMLHNYGQGSRPETQSILNMLIPRSKDGLTNMQCSMFREVSETDGVYTL